MAELHQNRSLTDIRNTVRHLENSSTFTITDPNQLNESLTGIGIGLWRLLDTERHWDLVNLQICLIPPTRERPGRFEPTFNYLPENPLRTVVMDGIIQIVDLRDAFAFRYRDLISGYQQTVMVDIDQIGPIVSFEKALQQNTAPFYLLRTSASAKQHLDGSMGVSITPILEDLADFNRRRINALRRSQYQQAKRFPIS